jgi:hypothetical protein
MGGNGGKKRHPDPWKNNKSAREIGKERTLPHVSVSLFFFSVLTRLPCHPPAGNPQEEDENRSKEALFFYTCSLAHPNDLVKCTAVPN